MRPRATVCLTALVAVSLGGCGTVNNCLNGNGGRTIYGGVKQDAQNGSRHLAEAFTGPAPSFAKMPKPPNAGRDFLAKSFCASCGVGMLAVDLPLSVVGDTLTLPLTVPSILMKRNPKARRKWKPRVMGVPSVAKP